MCFVLRSLTHLWTLNPFRSLISGSALLETTKGTVLNIVNLQISVLLSVPLAGSQELLNKNGRAIIHKGENKLTLNVAELDLLYLKSWNIHRCLFILTNIKAAAWLNDTASKDLCVGFTGWVSSVTLSDPGQNIIWVWASAHSVKSRLTWGPWGPFSPAEPGKP